jgi:hypothetical protein
MLIWTILMLRMIYKVKLYGLEIILTVLKNVNKIGKMEKIQKNG